jgi:hypothetical protein
MSSPVWRGEGRLPEAERRRRVLRLRDEAERLCHEVSQVRWRSRLLLDAAQRRELTSDEAVAARELAREAERLRQELQRIRVEFALVPPH